MASPHYIFRRSRSGRFNFTLLSEHGRISGSIVVPVENRPRDEVLRLAEAKVRALAEEFREITARASPP